MFGDLLSSAIRITTLPLDAANIAMDVATGGSGSKHSRSDSPLGALEEIRDAIADTAQEIDE